MKTTNLKKITTQLLTICAVILGLTAMANAAVNPELISKSPNGDSGNGHSRSYSVSGDGRYVVFESAATNLVSGIADTNEGTDIFLRDMQNGTTRCLSCLGTSTGNGASFNPLITPDGRYVLFNTGATDLVGGTDVNNEADIIYVDMISNERKLVSAVPSETATGNGYSGLTINGRAYDMSDDGRYVVFSSNASNLTGVSDTNDKNDIFVRDMQLGSTRVISKGIGNANTGNNFSVDPSISADGNIIAFTSAANNLIATDGNIQTDVYVYYYAEQFMKAASMSTRTDTVSTGSGASYNAVISKDGNRVAFFTDANDITNIPIPFEDPYTNVVVHDLGLNQNTLATVSISGNSSANNTSGSGNLFRFNISISADGRYVTFETRANNLSLTPTNNAFKVVRRDLTRGITEIVSLKPSGTAATQNTFAGFRGNAMSRDGRFVTFQGTSDLAPDYPGALGGFQIYVRDMLNGVTTALTLKNDGTDLSATGGGDPVITQNGKAVVFLSGANDLTPTTNAALNVFKAAVPAPQKAVADFDGDGRTDFTVFRPSNGTWYFLNNSANFASYRVFGLASDKLAPADFTGDGRTDYAVFRPSTGDWFISDGLTFNETHYRFGQSGDKPVPQDYDGDGKDDIAVYRNGTWWSVGSRTGEAAAYQFGLADDIPVFGDFDGDGKADYAVFRPSNGTWYIRKTSSGAIIYFTFGQNGDKPVAADYDGDGKTDIAVYRGGDWYIQRSLTGTISTARFGLATDIPSVGSFDGDGKADIAVWRPSSGDWYVINSTSNSIRGIHYGQTGDAPVSSAYVQ